MGRAPGAIVQRLAGGQGGPNTALDDVSAAHQQGSEPTRDVLRLSSVGMALHGSSRVYSAGPGQDRHQLKAGENYQVDRSRLPEGYVMLDQVRTEFA